MRILSAFEVLCQSDIVAPVRATQDIDVNRVRHVFDPEASAVRLRQAPFGSEPQGRRQSSRSAERLSLRLRPVVRQAHHPEEDRREGSPSTRFLSSGGSGVLGGSLRAPFDAREATLHPQKACHEQAGKALDRKLSPRVEWWPQRDSNPRFRLERLSGDLSTE